jgi:uncharacterized protein YcbK (DUF882 family)
VEGCERDVPVLAPPADYWTFALESFVAHADELLAVWPEAVLTSWWRSPVENRRVGGVPNSRHLYGAAFDAVLPRALVAGYMADARWLGLRPIDERDHVHVQDR